MRLDAPQCASVRLGAPQRASGRFARFGPPRLGLAPPRGILWGAEGGGAGVLQMERGEPRGLLARLAPVDFLSTEPLASCKCILIFPKSLVSFRSLVP